MGRKASNKRGPSQARVGKVPPDYPPSPPRPLSEAEQAAKDAMGAPLNEYEIRNRAEALRKAMEPKA